MDFLAWDEAIAARLQPIRTELGNIPVAALPQKVGKLGIDASESIDWLFPSYTAQSSDRTDGIQDVTVNLEVRLYFQKRYPTAGAEKNALEWAETQVLRLLPNFWLPSSYSPLRLQGSPPFVPARGQWHKKIMFYFKARLEPDDAIDKLPVQILGIDASQEFLVEVGDDL
jgi:hypothetical protein